MRTKCLVVCLGLVLLAGCASSPPAREPNEPFEPELAHGYALLYELVSKQRCADGLFVLRPASEATREAVRKIARACDEMTDAMERRQRAGLLPALDVTGLPDVEQDVRDAIESQTTRAVLFGGDSERRMVLAQMEATRYAAALAGSLARRDQRAEARWREQLTTFADAMSNSREALLERITLETSPPR